MTFKLLLRNPNKAPFELEHFIFLEDTSVRLEENPASACSVYDKSAFSSCHEDEHGTVPPPECHRTNSLHLYCQRDL